MGTTVRTQRWPAILEPDVTLKAADRLLTSRPVLSAFADMVRRAGQTGGLRLLPFFPSSSGALASPRTRSGVISRPQ